MELTYVHCRKCLASIPPDISPAAWSDIAVGRTPEGFVQVWCNRHNVSITLIKKIQPQSMDCGNPNCPEHHPLPA